MKQEDKCVSLLDKINDKRFKRNDIALTYRMALESSYQTDWKEVNTGIINRWSRSGLKYIKHKAWKGDL